MPNILIIGCSSGFGHLTTLRSCTECTTAEEVAEAVWRAVTDPQAPMKMPAGADAQTWFREAGHTVA